MRQIIAIGGGGFGREIGELKIERYIKEQSKKKNPKICFKNICFKNSRRRLHEYTSPT